jgi:hypothetical protein
MNLRSLRLKSNNISLGLSIVVIFNALEMKVSYKEMIMTKADLGSFIKHFLVSQA